MSLLRILENDDWIVDYDRERGQYRVSYFEDYHFRDELWFDEYNEKKLNSKPEDTVEKLEKLKDYCRKIGVDLDTIETMIDWIKSL